ncbi:hypothetical protein LCGC14_2714020 [marine sediment metagenome]|uniref:Uncharacterized protein n=1 Tax=marine sediment metagenome TaxID=412755 RepID=A0A0F8ZBY0_9ZZZZ
MYGKFLYFEKTIVKNQKERLNIEYIFECEVCFDIYFIINISSVGGRVTTPLFSLYHGTKFAVEGFSESLQMELLTFCPECGGRIPEFLRFNPNSPRGL